MKSYLTRVRDKKIPNGYINLGNKGYYVIKKKYFGVVHQISIHWTDFLIYVAFVPLSKKLLATDVTLYETSWLL